MNGVHDMGGMHGMGPIEYEPDEPVFHHRWEARIYALTRAAGAWRKWNIDAGRHGIERIPAADYLRMSYYERWAVRLIDMLIRSGLVTREEIAAGRPDPGAGKRTPPLTAEMVPDMVARRGKYDRDIPAVARFKPGDRVRTRNINPIGHTRLPRYARAKTGEIARDHGVFVFPDTNAHFQGEHPQHLYSVRFEARELWGADAPPRDSVFIDLWENYLEP